MSKSRFGIKVSKRAVEIAHLDINGKKAPRQRGGKTGGGGATTPEPTLFDKLPAPTPAVFFRGQLTLFPKE